ncbi:MAG: HAMP domain-containing protein, partial [Spirochaetales bacterium]|nr:HAMP domain-containing protein [Spirochaetales bacterium]
MKIKTKLQLSAIFTVALTCIIGLIIFMAVLRVSEENSHAEIASKIEHDVIELSLIINEYLLYQGERQLIQQNLKQQALSHNLAIAEFKETDEKILVNDIRSNHEYINAIFYELTTVNKKWQELSAEQKAPLSERQDRLHGQILVKSQLMISDAFRVHHIIKTKLNKSLQQTVLLISILLITMILLVLTIALWIYNSIVPPVVRLEHGTQILGAGNLDHKVGIDSEDEIGQLSRSFDQMTGRLKETTVSRDLLVKEMSERKRAKDALKKSEEWRLDTLDASPFPIAIVHVNNEEKVSFWSQSAQVLFGHTAPTVHEWFQLAYPDPDYRREVTVRWNAALDKARQSSLPVNAGEYRVTCRDGSVRLCELYAMFLSEILIVTFNDITERKEIEAGLETIRKELAATKIAEDAAHEYAESVLETVREPLLALDSDMRVVKANQSFYHSFKATPQGTIGHLIYDLGNRQWDIPKLRTLLEEILPKDHQFDDYEVEHNFLNIGHKIMLLNARRVTQKESGSQLILLAIEEVTGKIRLQRQLAERTRDAEKAQSEAESANRAKSDFLANMSHELRT